MIYACTRLVKKYPNFAIFVGGFCLMASPALIGVTLLLWSLAIERRPDATVPLLDATVIVLMTSISPPFQIAAWTLFTAGFCVMIAGVIRAHYSRSVQHFVPSV
jgi:hypothetical protein